MLDKCEEGTRYIYRKQFESAIVPTAFSVASARRDERESRESHPGGEIRTISTIFVTLKVRTMKRTGYMSF